jgi:hypothetical protein
MIIDNSSTGRGQLLSAGSAPACLHEKTESQDKAALANERYSWSKVAAITTKVYSELLEN